MRIPLTGTTATPGTVSRPAATSPATAGSTGAVIGRAAHHHVPLTVMRRPAVRGATPSMSRNAISPAV